MMVTTRPKKMVDSLWSNVKKIEWTQNETRGERFNMYYVLFAAAKNLGDVIFLPSFLLEYFTEDRPETRQIQSIRE
jgi:hypothetical protein